MSSYSLSANKDEDEKHDAYDDMDVIVHGDVADGTQRDEARNFSLI